MNEEMLKKIVSTFIKVSPELITNETPIGKNIIQGSILFHRMISRINDHYKIDIQNYKNINYYSDLLKIIRDENK